MVIPLIALALGSPLQLVEPAQGRASIRVHDMISGCCSSKILNYAWELQDGAFRRGESFISQGWVDALRTQVLGSSGTPPDLLSQAGITPASIALHRNDIVRAAWPPQRLSEELEVLILPAELEHLISYESLAPRILDELLGKNWSSTTQCKLTLEIPGDPLITIRSDGEVPWKLPWKIEAGGKTWESSDLALSRSLAELVDAGGPHRRLIDGTRYWSDEFWRDRGFWRGVLGTALDAALVGQEYGWLVGHSVARDRFRYDIAPSGAVNSQPDSLLFRIRTKSPYTLDGAWWCNPPRHNKPTTSWKDFASVYDAALRCVERETWLKDWKLAGPDRTLEVQVVGRVGYAETMRDQLVLPPWKDSGLQGDAEFEICMRRKDEWCGTVWLSSTGEGSLIATAHAGEGDHWFDRLEFSFQPTKPTYVRVDAAGKFESRTIVK